MLDRKESDSLCNYLLAHGYLKIRDFSKPGPHKNKDLYILTTYLSKVILNDDPQFQFKLQISKKDYLMCISIIYHHHYHLASF